MQRCGINEVLKSFQENEEIKLVLVRRDSKSPDLSKIRSMANELGIRVIEGSDNDLWRMSRDNSHGIPDVLGFGWQRPKPKS